MIRNQELKMVALSGFEPESPAPKASMIDHYTTGLLSYSRQFSYLRFFQSNMSERIL
jgi:hypothetical protein